LALLICTLFSVATVAAPLAPQATPRVLLHTSAGDITLTLDTKAAPKTVANFLQYVNEGFYNNTLFHRVIPDFMIQGGGFQPGMIEKATREPILNESNNGLKNNTGTIAMARTADPDSATAQFFINLVDNDYLNGSESKPGYAVFGKVTSGMDIVNRIAHVKTGTRNMYQDVPVQDVIIISAKQLP
jgi:cyclophilin family peptidyl-prolyl cis-trans isomerase